MKEKTLIFTACGCVLLCGVLLFFCRTVPSGKIWKAYSVAYVHKSVPAETVLGLLDGAGITGVLSSEHEPFPPLSRFAPVQYGTYGAFSYRLLQSVFFADKSDAFALYYIPEHDTEKAVRALSASGAEWGIAGRGGDRRAVPAAVFILFLIFLVLAENRLFFACAFFPFVCYTAASPFYDAASFVCLLGFGLFIGQKFWRRRGFLKKTAANAVLAASLFLLILCSAFSGIKTFFAFFAAALASCSLVYLLYKIAPVLRSKKSFNPVLIIPARWLSFGTVLRMRFAFVPAVCVCFFTFSAVRGFSGISIPHAKSVYIPAPVRKTMQKDFSALSYKRVLRTNASERLPDLTDFIHGFWYMQTYPFKKLEKASGKTETVHGRPQLGEQVEYPNYEKDGHKLKEVAVTTAVFDESYITDVIRLALGNEASERNVRASGGAEMLLAKQNGFVRTAYRRSDGTQNNTSVFVFTLCAFIYILFLLGTLGIKRLI